MCRKKEYSFYCTYKTEVLLLDLEGMVLEYMSRGRVKWFNNEKGYGFIDYKENEDVFVHYSAIKQDGYKSLSEGQFVEFRLLETTKGYQALDVNVLKETTTIN